MKAAILLQEPTPHRMLIRFALVIGLLFVAAQIAVLLNLHSMIALLGLSTIPALGVPIAESALQASARRARKTQEAVREKEAEKETLRAEISGAIEEMSQRNAANVEKAAQEAAEHVANRISSEASSSQEAIRQLKDEIAAILRANQAEREPVLEDVRAIRAKARISARYEQIYERMLEELANNPNADPKTVQALREDLQRRRKALWQVEQTEEEK